MSVSRAGGGDSGCYRADSGGLVDDLGGVDRNGDDLCGEGTGGAGSRGGAGGRGGGGGGDASGADGGDVGGEDGRDGGGGLRVGCARRGYGGRHRADCGGLVDTADC